MKEVRSLKPVFEKMVSALRDRMEDPEDDEKDAIEAQLNDVYTRWDYIEETVNRRENIMDELQPKVEEYHGMEERIALWLPEAEDKLKRLPKIGTVSMKEYNTEVKVIFLLCTLSPRWKCIALFYGEFIHSHQVKRLCDLVIQMCNG